jgi:hypothetical protein
VLDTKTNAGDPTGVEGGMYYNSSSRNFRCFVSGAWRNCIGGVVFANTSLTGNTFGNSAAENNFASNYSIPADDCQPGRVYRVTARGVYGTTAAPGTFTIRMKLGATVVATTGANTPTASLTNRGWETTFDITCITAGGSGTVEGQGVTRLSTTAIAANIIDMENTATVTVNTTAAQTLQMSAQWATANAANTITLRQIVVEAL